MQQPQAYPSAVIYDSLPKKGSLPRCFIQSANTLMILNLFWQRYQIKRYTALGLFVSLGLHLAIIPLALQEAPRQFPQPIMVSLVNDPTLSAITALDKLRTVSEPENRITTEANPEAKFMAEQTRITAKEQIKRGSDPQAGNVVSPKLGANQAKQQEAAAVNKQPSTVVKSEQFAASNKQAAAMAAKPPPLLLPSDLLLDSKTALETFALEQSKPEIPDPLANLDVADIQSYKPFSRPSGSGAAFLGSRGQSDYLPHLVDGDITLLNTKASKFAVFVRRVATQVFSELRQSGWETLSASDVYSIREFSRIRATMDLDGKLIEVTLEGRSGSHRFDQTVLSAVRKGTRDPRPPPEAAVNGKIYFLFQAKSWVRQTTDPRSGFPSQARWLLLGTGLE